MAATFADDFGPHRRYARGGFFAASHGGSSSNFLPSFPFLLGLLLCLAQNAPFLSLPGEKIGQAERARYKRPMS